MIRQITVWPSRKNPYLCFFWALMHQQHTLASLHLWVDGLRRSRRLRRSRCLRISIPVLLLSLFGANRLLFFGAARDAAVCSRFFSFFNLARSRARA